MCGAKRKKMRSEGSRKEISRKAPPTISTVSIDVDNFQKAFWWKKFIFDFPSARPPIINGRSLRSFILRSFDLSVSVHIVYHDIKK